MLLPPATKEEEMNVTNHAPNIKSWLQAELRCACISVGQVIYFEFRFQGGNIKNVLWDIQH